MIATDTQASNSTYEGERGSTALTTIYERIQHAVAHQSESESGRTSKSQSATVSVVCR